MWTMRLLHLKTTVFCFTLSQTSLHVLLFQSTSLLAYCEMQPRIYEALHWFPKAWCPVTVNVPERLFIFFLTHRLELLERVWYFHFSFFFSKSRDVLCSCEPLRLFLFFYLHKTFYLVATGGETEGLGDKRMPMLVRIVTQHTVMPMFFRLFEWATGEGNVLRNIEVCQ